MLRTGWLRAGLRSRSQDGCGSGSRTNGRIRRWLPRGTDLDEISEADIQEIAMTINLTPRKCLGFRSPVEAFLSELGRDVRIRFA